MEGLTHGSDDLALHELAHGCVHAIHVALEVQPEIILRLLPLFSSHRRSSTHISIGRPSEWKEDTTYVLQALLMRIRAVQVRHKTARSEP